MAIKTIYCNIYKFHGIFWKKIELKDLWYIICIIVYYLYFRGVNMYAMLTGNLPFTVEPFNIKALHTKMLHGDMNAIPETLSSGE